MALIQFTRNYTDRSNDYGFQFEFYCDKCKNGHMSSFLPSKVGVAASVLRAAGSLFGGALGRAARAGTQVKDALRGKAWDEAFSEAVAAAQGHFKHCTRCGRWVCPQACWNEVRGLCEGCAPDLGEEAASAQAQAAAAQVREKARKVEQVASLDMRATRVAACPHCSARVEGSRFCPGCGKPLAAAKASCARCGAALGATAKFCGECGAPRSA